MQRISSRIYGSGLLLAMGLSLSGCGGGGGDDTPTPPPVKQYSVQLSVSNLQGSLAIQLNGQSNMTVSKDGTYTFDKQLTSGTAYTVTVATQPGYQQCTVSAGSGTINSSDITNVTVACTDQVQMTALSEYYPASMVPFSVPTSSTESLSVTISGTPLTVQKGSDGSHFVMLPSNAAGSVELKYSIGSFTRTKAITVQSLTAPSDPKTYVATQYQTLLTNAQQLRSSSANPSLYDGLIAELEKSKGQLGSLSADQQTALALYLMQLTQPAAGASLFAESSLLSNSGTACNVFVDNFNKNWFRHGLALSISIGAFTIGDPLIKAVSTAGMFYSFYNLTALVDKLFKDGRSCIQLINLALTEDPSGLAIVSSEFAQNYTQSTSAALLKTGSTYRYTLKPTIGFDALIASALSSVSADLRRILRPLPSAITQPLLSLLDRIDSPVLNDLSYQVTADPITGVNMDMNVDGNKLTVSPRISDLSKLTQSNYPTKWHIKTSLGDKVQDVDATVVVDFKPVVQNTQLQAIINKKTEGKLIAENVTSFAVVTQPTLGVLNLDTKTGAFDYTPNADTVGKKDTFTVRGTFLLGGDPNKSFVSELATVTIDIAAAEFCNEMIYQPSSSKVVQITCYFDAEKKKIKTENSFGVTKHSDGQKNYDARYRIINEGGFLTNYETRADMSFGLNYQITGQRMIVLEKNVYAYTGDNLKTFNQYIYRYETDAKYGFLGVHSDMWSSLTYGAGNQQEFGETLTCINRSWAIDKVVSYKRTTTNWITKVSEDFTYDFCPKIAQNAEKTPELTIGSRAEKRFYELFPDF